MARLISFLACGLVVGFFAGGFQIPNMIPIMLMIFWVGMGAGLRLGYALVGAALMPIAIVLPMWLLPGPTSVGRIYPPDDSRLAEMFVVSGAEPVYQAALEEYRRMKADHQAKVAEGTAPLPDAKVIEEMRATRHKAGVKVLMEAAGRDERPPKFDIWPLRTAWAAGLLITIASFTVNTLTSRPFRDPRPLGLD